MRDQTASRSKDGRVTVEVASGNALGGLIVAALFSAACWLAVALLVFVTLVANSGWLVPLLVATGLLIGFAIGLGPALLYRREVKALEGALEMMAAELSDRVRLESQARDSKLPGRTISAAELTGSGEMIRSWWAQDQGHG